MSKIVGCVYVQIHNPTQPAYREASIGTPLDPPGSGISSTAALDSACEAAVAVGAGSHVHDDRPVARGTALELSATDAVPLALLLARSTGSVGSSRSRSGV